MTLNDAPDPEWVAACRQLADFFERLDPMVSPEIAAGIAATEVAIREMHQEFILLSERDIHIATSGYMEGTVDEHRRGGQLIAFKWQGEYVYPGFQLNPATGRIYESIPQLVAVALKYDRSMKDLAQWICDPSGYLPGGGRPVDHIDNPAKVLKAAEGHYGVEW